MHPSAEKYRNEIQILVVDDYPVNQQIAILHLEAAGYKADLATNGLEALEAFKKKSYDLVFMDIQMPQMDGLEATKAIRDLETVSPGKNMEGRLESLNKVPIVAMSAVALKGERDIYIEAGMDDCLSKPFKRKDILGMVEKWVTPIHTPGNLDSGESQVLDTDPQKVADLGAEPLNFDQAIEEFGGDEPLVMEVLTGFIEYVGEQIGLLRLALSESDTNTIQKGAHGIRGGALNITADALSSAALELENMGSSGNLEKGAKGLERLEEEFERLKTFALNKRDS